MGKTTKKNIRIVAMSSTPPSRRPSATATHQVTTTVTTSASRAPSDSRRPASRTVRAG